MAELQIENGPFDYAPWTEENQEVARAFVAEKLRNPGGLKAEVGEWPVMGLVEGRTMKSIKVGEYVVQAPLSTDPNDDEELSPYRLSFDSDLPNLGGLNVRLRWDKHEVTGGIADIIVVLKRFGA